MITGKFLDVLNIPIDPDTKKFLDFTGIIDPRIVTALNNLVLDLKRFGIWTKRDAIYPFVGGTNHTNLFNLKNPFLYKLLIGGTVTFNYNGPTGDGATGYLDTQYVIPAGKQNSFSMSVYCRNNTQGNFCDMGTCTNNASAFTQLYLRQSGGGNAYSAEINQTGATATFLNTNSQGFYVGSRTASNVVVSYKNGVSVASDTDVSTTPSTAAISILARNSSPPGGRISFSNHNLAYCCIGDGLTAAEVSIYNTIVQQFQTALGRQV